MNFKIKIIFIFCHEFGKNLIRTKHFLSLLIFHVLRMSSQIIMISSNIYDFVNVLDKAADAAN